MNRLLFLNRLPWLARLPIKWAVFSLTVLFVFFPYPGRLIVHVQRWRNPNALIEPDAPALAPWLAELRPRLDGAPAPKEALRRVERFVYEKLPYEWDWVTWGTADYLPTVTEAIEKGKEDCDGRAVVAASLLRNFGFNAQLVTDFSHVWVKTDQGETMGPGKNKAVVGTERGLRISKNALSEVPRAMAYGVSVFPGLRETIIMVVLWWLLLHRRCGVKGAALSILLLIGGLFVLRAGGRNYLHPTGWMQWSGLILMVAGAILPFAQAMAVPRRT